MPSIKIYKKSVDPFPRLWSDWIVTPQGQQPGQARSRHMLHVPATTTLAAMDNI